MKYVKKFSYLFFIYFFFLIHFLSTFFSYSYHIYIQLRFYGLKFHVVNLMITEENFEAFEAKKLLNTKNNLFFLS